MMMNISMMIPVPTITANAISCVVTNDDLVEVVVVEDEVCPVDVVVDVLDVGKGNMIVV